MRDAMTRFFFSDAPPVERDRRRRELWLCVMGTLLTCAGVALILWLSYAKAPR
jgi:hypothetical protein